MSPLCASARKKSAQIIHFPFAKRSGVSPLAPASAKSNRRQKSDNSPKIVDGRRRFDSFNRRLQAGLILGGAWSVFMLVSMILMRWAETQAAP